MWWVIGLLLATGLVILARWSGHPVPAVVFPFIVVVVAAGLLRHLVSPLLRQAQQKQEAAVVEAAGRRSPVEVQVVSLRGGAYQVLVNGVSLAVGLSLDRALDRATAISRQLKVRRIAVLPVSGPWRNPTLSQANEQHDSKGQDGH